MPPLRFPEIARADLPVVIDALDVLMDAPHKAHLIGWTEERQQLRDQFQQDLDERTA
jgi:hypothetical protein